MVDLAIIFVTLSTFYATNSFSKHSESPNSANSDSSLLFK